jgi:hypothetical protein
MRQRSSLPWRSFTSSIVFSWAMSPKKAVEMVTEKGSSLASGSGEGSNR